MSNTLERLLLWLEREHGFVREVAFRGLSGKRRFKFDAAREDLKVAVDYHGWGAGAAHMARNKQAGDHEKVSEAALCGWIYIVCDALSVANGKCMGYVDQAVNRIPS